MLFGVNGGKANSDGLVDVACLSFLIVGIFCTWALYGTYRSGYSAWSRNSSWEMLAGNTMRFTAFIWAYT